MARAFLLMEALETENGVDERSHMRHLRRNFRDIARPMSLINFSRHFRLTKESFVELCSEIEPYLPRSHRSTKLSVECEVLTALSFYATGSYQKSIGMSFLHNVSQSSVSRSVKAVTLALNHPTILKKYIKFPQNRQERQVIINGFSNKYGISGVLGCIDGTHIALVRPSDHQERFLNRKHYYSRNVQIICDSNLNILNVDATFGGATHDAHIWKNSEIYNHMVQLHDNGENVWFLGDSGYPLRPWLLTPIVNAEPGSPEEHYTNVHCRVRNTVERCIGVLKARWRCLLIHRVMHYHHHDVAKIINACAVLHNIANMRRLPAPRLSISEAQGEARSQVLQQQYMEENSLLEDGRQQRQIIVQNLWRSRSRSSR